MQRAVALTLALALVSTVAAAGPAGPAAPTTTVTWHGHAAFEIITPSGKVLFIDPWLKNPANPNKHPLAAVQRADFILVTHGHGDHVGESVELAKRTGARLVAGFELGQAMAAHLGFPEKQVGYDGLGNPGGELRLGDGEIVVRFVAAVHSSSIDAPGVKGPLTTGAAVGFVVKIKDGPTIYHSGDTAYYCDMEQIGTDSPPDLALLNIGGHFGMEPPAAARAAKAVKAKLVVPHHFKTFPILTQETAPFFKLLDEAKIAHRELSPGGSLVFSGPALKN